MPKKEKDSKSSNFRGSLKENFFKYVGTQQIIFPVLHKIVYLSTYMCKTDHVLINKCMYLGN